MSNLARLGFRQKYGKLCNNVIPVLASNEHFSFLQGGVEDGEKESSSKSDFRRQSTRASDGAGSSSRR